MKKVILLSMVLSFLFACSQSSDVSNFPSLPSNSSERVTVTGKMAWWFYEGDGGCFGTLENRGSEIQLWVDVDTCGDKEYAENEDASLEITFNPDNQYGPGKTYTIVAFK